MSNLGYREILDFGVLSIKQLNDNLRALWSKVMGDIEVRDLAGDTLQLINSKAASEDLQHYSTIEQTEDAIQMAVVDLNLEKYSTLTQTAEQIALAVEDKASRGELILTADSLSSAIADKASKAELTQTASALTSSIVSVSGRVSELEHNDAGVAVRLKDPRYDFEVAVGQVYNKAGMTLKSAGSAFCYVVGDAEGAYIDSMGTLDLISAGAMHLKGQGNANMWLLYDSRKGGYAMNVSGHIVPDTGNFFDLGGDGNGMRWRRVYTNNAVDTSDVRAKHDVAPLEASDLLMRLRPVRYRLNEDPEKLRFGFVAQEIAEALRGADYADANLLIDDNPEHLGLVYKELIAVLVEGYQRQQGEIEALRKELQARQ